MKNLFFAFLLFFTSMNFNNAVGMDKRFDKRVFNYMQAGMSREDATTIALEELTGSSSSSSRHIPTEYEIDEASANLIKQLTLTDQANQSAHTSYADTTLARRITSEDAATEDLIRQLTTVRGIHECTIVQILLFNTNITTHRRTIAPLVTFLGSIPQGADVHVLDGEVPGNMAALHAIGDDFAIDNSALTVANMRDYLLPRTTGYAGYDGTAVTATQLVTDITNALSTASGDASTLGMYSRVVSLIQNLEDELGQENESVRFYLNAIFDAIAENRITRGGCFAGVRNRAYVRYVYMLHELMGK